MNLYLLQENQSYNYLILQHISVARKRDQPNGEVQGEVEEGTTSSKTAGACGVVPQRRHHWHEGISKCFGCANWGT